MGTKESGANFPLPHTCATNMHKGWITSKGEKKSEGEDEEKVATNGMKNVALF